MIMSKLKKDKIIEQNLHSNKKMILSLKQNKGGQNFGIVVKPSVSKKTKSVQIPADGVKEVKMEFNISNNTMTGIQGHFEQSQKI